jgi:putative membrane protein
MLRSAGMPRDSLWKRYRRWQGIILVAASLVATVWLGATNQLILYIHPRYVVFTVIMAIIGLVLVVASFIDRPDHDHDDKPTAMKTVLSVVATVLTLGVAVALVLVPPATLTTATADQRVINSVNVGSSSATVASSSSASSAASAKFTVLDWSSLLRQTSASSFYAGKAVDVVGFITADKDDPANLFYLSRFVITCCAVDAQPVGVPVYLADWKSHYTSNEWVRITGQFVTNPSRTSQQTIALVPLKTSKVKQPSDPYLY